MPHLAWHGRAVLRAVRSLLPVTMETTMTVLSARAAWILLANQQYFDESPANYAWLVQHVTSHEWAMGLLALVAALLKAVGLVCRRAGLGAADLVFACRQFGWTASAIFWGLIGISILVGAPRTLGSANTIALGILAVTMMLSDPVTPEVHDGR